MPCSGTNVPSVSVSLGLRDSVSPTPAAERPIQALEHTERKLGAWSDALISLHQAGAQLVEVLVVLQIVQLPNQVTCDVKVNANLSVGRAPNLQKGEPALVKKS